MDSACSRCGARVVEGEAFCVSCGTPLSPGPPTRLGPGAPHAGVLLDPQEAVAGELRSMFSFARQRGPVRVLLTDRRLIVLWQGDHHLLPSRARYNAWRSGLAETLSWHLGDADPPRATEQLAWDIPNRLVSNLFAATMQGIGGDRRLSMLNITVFSEFLTGSRELGRYGETVPLLSLVVYGPAESLNDFLRHTPLATRVSRHWHVGKRLDP